MVVWSVAAGCLVVAVCALVLACLGGGGGGAGRCRIVPASRWLRKLGSRLRRVSTRLDEYRARQSRDLRNKQHVEAWIARWARTNVAANNTRRDERYCDVSLSRSGTIPSMFSRRARLMVELARVAGGVVQSNIGRHVLHSVPQTGA
jgi:hypothetical protein